MGENKKLCAAIDKLQAQYPELNWGSETRRVSGRMETFYTWPGAENEDLMITIHKSCGRQETFHRHDYFYFNYTYQGQYESLSHKYDCRITIREKELYAGQPFAGHALCSLDDRETIIIGVLIRPELFYKAFLPMMTANSKLFHFFLDPVTNSDSDEYIHFKIENDCSIRSLLEMMVIEYANRREDTQDVLKPLALAFLMQIARRYAEKYGAPEPEKLSDRIVQYMGEHSDSVTLRDISERFSYHPNYISTLLRRETGRSFSEILLQQRMDRALVLLKGTGLPISEIALMLGYGNSSNFYKAFRGYYHKSPRDYVANANQ